jgi:hypothetical protein
MGSGDDVERMNRLRERRQRLAAERERADRRDRFGAAVVEKLSQAFARTLSLSEFDTKAQMPIRFVARKNLADCPGLKAVHVSERALSEIIACCDSEMGEFSGTIGFEEYNFIGVVRLDALRLPMMLTAVKLLHDSIVLCPDGYESVMLVDFYKVGGISDNEAFSVVVQGAALEAKLTSCVNNCVRDTSFFGQ